MSTGHRPPKGSISELIAHYGQSSMTSVDVGANVGEVASVLAKYGPVTCIEPDSRCWETLRTRVPSATVLEMAVGEAPAMCLLFQSSDPAQSSLRAQAVTEWATTQSVTVSRLDDVVSQADLVKIDAQGAELAILRGAPKLLASCPVWILECWPHGLHVSGEDPLDLVRLCESAGLTVKWADHTPCTVESLTAWMALEPDKVTRHVNVVATR